MDNARTELLKKVQMYSFLLVDAGLFLDTHPTDANALSYYNQNKTLYNQYMSEYERTYGPITRNGVNPNDNTWRWIDNPWPWENEV